MDFVERLDLLRLKIHLTVKVVNAEIQLKTKFKNRSIKIITRKC